MGWFGDLIDDIFEIPEKIIEVPTKIINRSLCMGDHNWQVLEVKNKVVLICEDCGAKTTIG